VFVLFLISEYIRNEKSFVIIDCINPHLYKMLRKTVLLYSFKNKKVWILFGNFLAGFLIIIGLITCCDAPRNNPLDPENPNYIAYEISGTVQTLSLPHQPVQGAEIYWANNSSLIKTDDAGFFTVHDTDNKDGWLFMTKENYLQDSIYIEWGEDKIMQIESYLNAKPVLDSLLIYSIIQNRYPDIQILNLVIEAAVSDNDNDIDSIFVANNVLNFQSFLRHNASKQIYERTFSMNELGVSTPEAIIGHEIQICVKDKFNHRIFLDSESVKRIIKDEVNLKSPGSHEVVSSSPLLSWEPLFPGYKVNYTCEIYTDEIDPQLVWQKQNLSQNTAFYTVDITLPANEYFWVVWCIDEFNNRSRSKAKSFQVE
jgi:hypothetical protein